MNGDHPVYKEYNQEQLDLQYNNRYHVPDFEASLTNWETLSRKAQEKHALVKDVRYGDLSRELLDVFPSAHRASKTLVFIHGGYWHLFDKSGFYFVADAFAGYGVTTVLLNYPLAPAASMDQIVASCRNALHWLNENIERLNGDPTQLYLAGHSAGGHLASMLMTTDPHQPTAEGLQGVCTLSGVFDLTPVQHTRINDVLLMDTSVATRNSPVKRVPAVHCPMIIAVGAAETDEFRSQSSDLYKQWKLRNRSLELSEIPGLNHFTILDSITSTNSIVHQAICRLMKV